jgi:hypothetical protein
MLTRVCLAIAAGAAVLLGVERLFVVNGPDFRISTTQQRSATPSVSLRSESGELVCWIRLRLSVQHPAPVFHARVSNGPPLQARANRVKGDPTRWMLDLRAQPPVTLNAISATDSANAPVGDGAGPGLSHAEQFAWPAGQEIHVIVPGATDLRVDGWEVFSKDLGADSSAHATRRTISQFSVFFLVGLATVGACVGAWRVPEVPTSASPVTAELCIRTLIASMDAQEQKVAQRLLTNLLIERTSFEEALEATGIPSGWRRQQFFFKVSRQFKQRLENLLHDLEHYRSILR